jgi:hypothetical protein
MSSSSLSVSVGGLQDAAFKRKDKLQKLREAKRAKLEEGQEGEEEQRELPR